MYYKIPGLKIKRGELDNFLKKMEVKSANKEDRVIIKSKDLKETGEEVER